MSAPAPESLPPAQYPEIALIGRSNVGKSSLLNALVNQKRLARASVTPGRTQMINFFLLGEALMLVDLPGYGFAKAPEAMIRQWERLVTAYLRSRASLKRVLLLMDARRSVMPSDEEMMDMLDDAAVIYQPVLTKADKLSVPELAETLAATKAALAARPAAYPELFATSAKSGNGIEALRESLAMLIGKP